MAVKIYVLLTMLVFAGVVPPLAHAQLSGLGNIFGLLSGLLSVTGIVPCSVGNSNLSTAGFANATVELRCGNNVVGSTTTDNNGVFSMVTALPTTLLSLLSSCNLVVVTPLVKCNVGLPSTGNLVAPIVSTVSSLLGLITAVTGNFNFQQTIT